MLEKKRSAHNLLLKQLSLLCSSAHLCWKKTPNIYFAICFYVFDVRVCVCVRAALLNVAALQENVLSLVFHWSQYTEDNSQISVHLLKCAVKIGLITKCVQAATATAMPHFIFIDMFCLRIFNRYPVFFTTPECLHRFKLFQPQIIATKCSQSLVTSPPCNCWMKVCLLVCIRMNDEESNFCTFFEWVN